MSFLMARSIPLSQTSRLAWKEHGATFFSRDRTVDSMRDTVANPRPGWEFFINAGNSELTDLNPPSYFPVYNPGEVVNELLTPQVTRELLGDLMAPQTGEGEFVWFKDQGRGGRNKYKHSTDSEAFAQRDPSQYWEDHIEGTEYRIITVGDVKVQQFIRTGDNSARTYRWVNMSSLPSEVSRLVREASSRLCSNRSIVGWDVIFTESSISRTELRPSGLGSDEQEGRGGRVAPSAFILEGNTCPGVNTHTARRIVDRIRDVLAE